MQQMGLDATAKVSMTPEQYKKWQLNNEQQDGYSHLSSALGETQTGIKITFYFQIKKNMLS